MDRVSIPLELMSLGHRGRSEPVSIPTDAARDAWTAGRILGVDPYWLDAECKAGRLPYVEHRGLCFYPMSALRSAIANWRAWAARRPGRYKAPPPFNWRLDLAAKRRQQAHRLSNFSVPTWKLRIDTKRRLLDTKDEEAGLTEWQRDIFRRRRELEAKARC
jgi:hypothetical protein